MHALSLVNLMWEYQSFRFVQKVLASLALAAATLSRDDHLVWIGGVHHACTVRGETVEGMGRVTVLSPNGGPDTICNVEWEGGGSDIVCWKDIQQKSCRALEAKNFKV